MTLDIQIANQLEMALYSVFVVLLYIGLILTILLVSNIRTGRLLASATQRQAFQSEAMALLGKGDYSKLKEVAMQREATHPGDAVASYYLGMAHLQSNELVQAKANFERAIKLDANWRKLCTSHLDEIAKLLAKSKPILVDDER
jgi:cytochrome c-type biogenesis protein CcmH/NrfG